jgi:hypothetical protein
MTLLSICHSSEPGLASASPLDREAGKGQWLDDLGGGGVPPRPVLYFGMVAENISQEQCWGLCCSESEEALME